jgi:RNA polymerase sigma-70 factor (ECF subfamily)
VDPTIAVIEGGRSTADESREDSATPPDFETFFMAQHRSLFQALWVITRNAHEAEEIMQDAFLKLWERWDLVRAVSDPTGYLYRTAMNVFRSRVRRTRMAVRKTVGHLPPDDGLAAVESREAIVRALAPLTPRQRAALVLMDVLDLTSAQAGAGVGYRMGHL